MSVMQHLPLAPVVDKENLVAAAPHPKAPAVVASLPVRSAVQSRRRARIRATSPTQAAHAVSHARRHIRSHSAATTARTSVDVDMSDSTSFTAGVQSNKVKITFPTRLQRPAFREIDMETLAALDDEFANVPIEYIRDKLVGAGPELLHSVITSEAQACTGLPKFVEVRITDLAPNVPIPTHILAVFTKDTPRPGSTRQIKLFPVHQTVLAAHCANLPIFPPSNVERPAAVGDRVTLPVVTLCIPNTTTWPLLQHFLYTKRTDVLLSGILPQPNEAIPVEQTPRFLAATYTPAVLTSNLLRVHALWSNVCVLGVYDERLWRAIDMCWEILMLALSYAPSGVSVEPPAPAAN